MQITYDPSRVTYGQLLKVYFSVAHDPGCALQPLGVAARPRAHDEEDAEHEARGRSGSRHVGTGGAKAVVWKFDKKPASPLEFACHEPGHYEAGMKINTAWGK